MSVFLDHYRKRKSTERREYQIAKKYHLKQHQLAVLRFLGDGSDHDYHDIARATGIGSGLPRDLCFRHDNSLGAQGFVQETTVTVPDYTGKKTKDVLVFRITPEGKRLLGKMGIALSEPLPHFRERYIERKQAEDKEKEQAEQLGLTRGFFVILRSLADGMDHDYTDIARATGIGSGLAMWLRARNGGSLGEMGLVREDVVFTGDNTQVMTFSITAAGKRLLQRLKTTT